MGAAAASISVTYTIDGVTRSLGSAFGTNTAYIETKALDIGDAQMSYFIDKIISNITDRTEQTGLVLEIYGSDAENGPFDLLDTIDLSLEDPGYTDPPGMRYYKFRFVDSTVLDRWKIHGFTVYGEPGGDEF